MFSQKVIFSYFTNYMKNSMRNVNVIEKEEKKQKIFKCACKFMFLQNTYFFSFSLIMDKVCLNELKSLFYFLILKPTKYTLNGYFAVMKFIETI
jgi:hypothetical protein